MDALLIQTNVPLLTPSECAALKRGEHVRGCSATVVSARETNVFSLLPTASTAGAVVSVVRIDDGHSDSSSRLEVTKQWQVAVLTQAVPARARVPGPDMSLGRTGHVRALVVWVQQLPEPHAPPPSAGSSPDSTTGSEASAKSLASASSGGGEHDASMQEASTPSKRRALTTPTKTRAAAAARLPAAASLLSPGGGGRHAGVSSRPEPTPEPTYSTVDVVTVLLLPSDRAEDVIRRAVAARDPSRSCEGARLGVAPRGWDPFLASALAPWEDVEGDALVLPQLGRLVAEKRAVVLRLPAGCGGGWVWGKAQGSAPHLTPHPRAPGPQTPQLGTPTAAIHANTRGGQQLARDEQPSAGLVCAGEGVEEEEEEEEGWEGSPYRPRASLPHPMPDLGGYAVGQQLAGKEEVERVEGFTAGLGDRVDPPPLPSSYYSPDSLSRQVATSVLSPPPTSPPSLTVADLQTPVEEGRAAPYQPGSAALPYVPHDVDSTPSFMHTAVHAAAYHPLDSRAQELDAASSAMAWQAAMQAGMLQGSPFMPLYFPLPSGWLGMSGGGHTFLPSPFPLGVHHGGGMGTAEALAMAALGAHLLYPQAPWMVQQGFGGFHSPPPSAWTPGGQGAHTAGTGAPAPEATPSPPPASPFPAGASGGGRGQGPSPPSTARRPGSGPASATSSELHSYAELTVRALSVGVAALTARLPAALGPVTPLSRLVLSVVNGVPSAVLPAQGTTLLGPIPHILWSDEVMHGLASALQDVCAHTFDKRGGADNDAPRLAYLKAGAVPPLVELVRLLGCRDKHTFAALEHAIQALCNLAYHPACQDAMIRPGSGVGEVLLDRLRADGAQDAPNLNIGLKVARTLDALCWESRHMQERAIQLGVLEVGVESLRIHSHDAHAVLNLSRMLSTIARTVDALKALHAMRIADTARAVQEMAWAAGWIATRAHFLAESARTGRPVSPGKLLRGAGKAGPRAAAGLTLLAARAEAAWDSTLAQ